MNSDLLLAVQVFASIGSLLVVFAIAGAGIRWIYLRTTPRPALGGDELEELRAGLERLAENDRRVAELEERLDFTERMLAQAKPDGAIPPGRS